MSSSSKYGRAKSSFLGDRSDIEVNFDWTHWFELGSTQSNHLVELQLSIFELDGLGMTSSFSNWISRVSFWALVALVLLVSLEIGLVMRLECALIPAARLELEDTEALDIDKAFLEMEMSDEQEKFFSFLLAMTSGLIAKALALASFGLLGLCLVSSSVVASTSLSIFLALFLIVL